MILCEGFSQKTDIKLSSNIGQAPSPDIDHINRTITIAHMINIFNDLLH